VRRAAGGRAGGVVYTDGKMLPPPGFLGGLVTAGFSEARPVGPPTPPSRGTSVISGRQVELLQERGVSRVVVQALQ
jgi:hypothetical protein